MRSKVLTKAELPLVDGAEGVGIRFNLPGLALFSIGLVLASGALVYALVQSPHTPVRAATPQPAVVESAKATDQIPDRTPAWGELLTADVQLENPEEYLAPDFDPSQSPRWVFAGMSVDKLRALLTECGLTPAQTAQALTAPSLVTTATEAVIHPDRALVYSLPAEARAKLYAQLASNPANLYMYFPVCFANNSFELAMRDSKLAPEVIALIKPLLYQRGPNQYFSDHEIVMSQVSAPEQRRLLLKALSRQPAVLASLRVRPTSDVEKLLGYWTIAPGVRFKDLRPLLESLQRLPDGGTLNLLHLLPPFARERLYTFPLPPKAGDPAMDCHWSSLNFFNEQPDDRLGNPSYAATVLTKNYYPVQKPTAYGDVIVLVDEKNNGRHSAVYIADNIVFTKNGNSHQQPWMLMRMESLLATYSVQGNVRVIVYRQKSS